MKAKYDVTKHVLVPKHTKATEKDKKELFEKYQISSRELPRILKSDPGIVHLSPEEGDIIKIVRPSQTAGESIFFRRVING